MVVIAAIGAAAAGFLLSTPHSKSSTNSVSGSSSSTTTEVPFKISYDTITVGYKGGLFQLVFQDVSGKQIAGVVAVLMTPVQAAMCSGGAGPDLAFGHCLPASGKSYTFQPTAGGSFPAGTEFSGFASGAGPGSATAGQTYPLSIKVTYADGTSSNETVSAQALSG